jgi:hypothetical protein
MVRLRGALTHQAPMLPNVLEIFSVTYLSSPFFFNLRHEKGMSGSPSFGVGFQLSTAA